MSAKKTNEQFLKEARELNGNLFNYLSEYETARKKILIECTTCGHIFPQTPSSHLNCRGCPKCAEKSRVVQMKINSKKLNEKAKREFADKANKKHNFGFDYSGVIYIKSYIPVEIKCKKCGRIFHQIPSDHLSGRGCPYCNESKGEKLVGIFLMDNNIVHIPQHYYPKLKWRTRLRYDFYLPDYNLCIEYQGPQHFEHVNWSGKLTLAQMDIRLSIEQMKDEAKREYCIANNIGLLAIPYWDKDKIDEIISKKLKLSIT